MAFFQLSPPEQAARARATSAAIPSLARSLAIGALGFCVVSIAGFAPWPLFAVWVRGLGELSLYLACVVMFLAVSGPALHPLIIGPGSLRRFYQLFFFAFLAYAVVWVVAWMELRGRPGEITGAVLGPLVMAAIIAAAFDAWRDFPPAGASLVLGHAAGYFGGQLFYEQQGMVHRASAMLVWGALYGLGFGAGLGLCFYFCQRQVRDLLRRTA